MRRRRGVGEGHLILAIDHCWSAAPAPVRARQGMVSSAQPDATLAGVDQLLADPSRDIRALWHEMASYRHLNGETHPAVDAAAFLADEDMVEILISGCSDSEYSYDGEIDGRWNGVMTAYATSVIRKGQTWQEFYQLLRSYLPSDKYPQTPQLET